MSCDKAMILQASCCHTNFLSPEEGQIEEYLSIERFCCNLNPRFHFLSWYCQAQSQLQLITYKPPPLLVFRLKVLNSLNLDQDQEGIKHENSQDTREEVSTEL